METVFRIQRYLAIRRGKINIILIFFLDINLIHFRLPILFGENLLIGCTFPIQYRTLSSSCDSLRNRTFNHLLGYLDNLETLRVGAFGNSDSRYLPDWVPILWPDFGTEVSEETGQNGLCPNMILSLHIQVVYSHVGSLANPQAKIIGVKVDFGAPEDVRFKCLGSACERPNHSQKIELSTRVSFIDVTQPAVDMYSEFPKLEAKFPHDFFYPFIAENVQSEFAVARSGSQKCTFNVLSIFIIFSSLFFVQNVWSKKKKNVQCTFKSFW